MTQEELDVAAEVSNVLASIDATAQRQIQDLERHRSSIQTILDADDAKDTSVLGSGAETIGAQLTADVTSLNSAMSSIYGAANLTETLQSIKDRVNVGGPV